MDRSGESAGTGAVFISYRRDDAAGHAGRLFDSLVRDMGAERVFMDVDGIAPGADFVARIREAVAQADSLIALIGRRWLDASTDAGNRRLDDENDVVCLEIASALEQGLAVIPVLVDGASMPKPEDLPEPLAPLAYRNAVELSDTRWAYDTSRLVDAIRGVDKDRGVGLPAARQILLGRDQEADGLQRIFRDDPGVLVTITGTGGIGKTTLAIEVARRLTAGTAEPLFCDLTGIDSPDDLLPAIARAAGAAPPGDEEELAGLGRDLTEARALLVLDNFEHVLAAAPDLRRLLDTAPALPCLITSRAPLRIAGEREYPLPPLGLPPKRTVYDAGALEGIGAVDVFVVSAQRASPDFELTDDNANAIAEICRRLEGLPLALELAAARITLLTPQDMLKHLDHTLRLLTRGARDLPERQQTVRATVEWSHRLLSDSEREMFARLGVFHSSPVLGAIEAVCHPADPLEVVDGLQALVENNLVQAHDGADGDRRFRMLEVIREFAREQLEDSVEAERVREAHARHYADLGATNGPKLEGAGSAEWFGWFDTEYPNLRAAVLWAQDQEDPELSVRLLSALGYYVLARSLFEAERWYLEASRRPGLTPAQLAPVLLGLAHLRLQQGEDADAVPELVHECIAACEAAGDTRLLARAYVALQILHMGEPEKATAAGERALELALESDDFWLATNQKSNLGNEALLEGNLERAWNILTEALELGESHGFEDSTAGVHGNLAVVALMSNEENAAARHVASAMELASKFGYPEPLIYHLVTAGAVLSRAGRHEDAALLLGVAGAAAESMGIPVQGAEATLRDEAQQVTTEALGAERMRERLELGAGLSVDEGIAHAIDAIEQLRATPERSD